MMLRFSARIEGAEIICEIGSDTALTAPVFCFSLMAAPRVVSGGVMQRRLAGYGEVILPDIAAGQSHRLVLAYESPDYRPKNRAWLPLGAYLRVGKIVHALPEGFALGVRLGLAAQDRAPSPEALPPDVLPLLPPPQSWQATGGNLAFATLRPDPAFAGVAALAQRAGLAAFTAAEGLEVRPEITTDLAPEAYRIGITATGISIVAGSLAGAHYAAITLLSLRETCGGRLPCGIISDTPRFVWRGQHLDCARHFFSLDSIMRLLDVMALLKLNRFHWHFADDEAFRLELDYAPELARKTAWRGEGQMMPAVFGGGILAGGSYSRADVARVLAHAASLHIEVMPEIESPAHSHALIKAISGLRDPGDNGEEISVQGYLDNVVNPAMPETWQVLSAIIEEVASLFPMQLLHLGCDEAPSGVWSGSPAVQALMAQEDLQTWGDVQGWMMARLAAHLAAKGIRAAAWEEAAKGKNGGIGHGAILFSWTGQGAGLAAAHAGYDVVMCPAAHTYFDLAHSSDPEDWGATWAGILPLDKTLLWDPVPAESQDIAARILGVQGCFWGEFTTQDAQAEAMIAPRIFGLACKAWEPQATTSPARLRALIPFYAPIFDAMGWVLAPI
ncbi:beta-N-acetylhexosaminidase [Cypionkella sp.]|uniref:beta-N-acetylhexosaminidase n=1 Tax=Cypionkella sp. TaxID=2811411 RepID=UPI002FDE7F7F